MASILLLWTYTHTSPCFLPRMADPRPSSASAASSEGPSSPNSADCQFAPPAAAASRPGVTLLEPSSLKKKRRPLRLFRVFHSVFRTLPIITVTPRCSRPILCLADSHRRGRAGQHLSGTKLTGTLFGYRKGRVSLALQDSPNCLPTLIVELAVQTSFLLKEMGSGMVRIALECEKRPGAGRLLEEPMWTMFCNGKKSGYGVRKEAREEDLAVMEVLQAVSMGAGVLPANAGPSADGGGGDGGDGGEEVAYMRASFEHVVGSRDSETLYMLSPDGNSGPDLTIFFVRI